MSTRRNAPRDLGPAGRRLWRSVHEKYDSLTIGEVLLLTEACRCADTCSTLHTKSTEAHCPRSTLVELRHQRLTLARLVAALGI